jgi:hypothetical protein
VYGMNLNISCRADWHNNRCLKVEIFLSANFEVAIPVEALERIDCCLSKNYFC